MKIVIFDYGYGNVHSVAKTVTKVGAQVEITADSKKVLHADGLLVPGVGAFDACVRGLRKVGGDKLIDQRLSGGRPILGICVGMQVLFESSEEHHRDTSEAGLDQWPGRVERLKASVLPHMGWDVVDFPPHSALFSGVDAGSRVYFAHSYATPLFTLTGGGPFAAPIVSWGTHGSRFVAAVENGPLWATQFHPEKSGAVGQTLIRNWIEHCAKWSG